MSDIRRSNKATRHQNLSSNVGLRTKLDDGDISEMEKLSREITKNILTLKDSREGRVHVDDDSIQTSNLSALVNKVSTLKSIVDKLFNTLTKQCSPEPQRHSNVSLDDATLTGNPPHSTSENCDLEIPRSQNTCENSRSDTSVANENISKTKELCSDFKKKYDNFDDLQRQHKTLLSVFHEIKANPNRDSSGTSVTTKSDSAGSNTKILQNQEQSVLDTDGGPLLHNRDYTGNQSESQPNDNNGTFDSCQSIGSTRGSDFLPLSSSISNKKTVQNSRHADQSLRLAPKSDDQGCHGTDRNNVGKGSMEFKTKKKFKCKFTPKNDDNRVTFLLEVNSNPPSSLNEGFVDSYGEKSLQTTQGDIKLNLIKYKVKKKFKSKSTTLKHDNRMAFLEEGGDNQSSSINGHPNRPRNPTSQQQQSSSHTEGKTIVQDSVDATWQYLRKDDMCWYNYPPDTERQIEAKYMTDRESELRIMLNGAYYKIEFATMKQHNINSKQTMDIRRKIRTRSGE